MKKMGVLAFLMGVMVIFAGCGGDKGESMEHDHDCGESALFSTPRYDISIGVPADTVEVMAHSNGGSQMYAQEDGDFTLTTQILQADNLELLLQDLTGQGRCDLTILTTWQEGMPRHELSWVCAGEEGLEVCRGVVIDDGSHYYAVIAAAPELRAEECSQQIAQCLSGVCLTENESEVITVP